MTDHEATFAEPKEGDTITRITVSECIYVWRLHLDGTGDWYPDGPKTVYEHPKWKDVPGAS